MVKSNNELWVYVEHHLGQIEPVSFQLISKARAIAGKMKVVAILLETPQDNFEDILAEYGPDQILMVKNSRLKYRDEMLEADLLAQLANRYAPNSILLGATVYGRSLSPRLQGKLQTGLTADCLDLAYEDDLLIQIKPSFGDNIMCEIVTPSHCPQMATVRPNIFKAIKVSNSKSTLNEVNDLTFSLRNDYQIIEELPIIKKGVSLAEAERVIGIGRGIYSEATIPLIEEVAKKLGAHIGVTRPLTDNTVFSVLDQIGQSGQTISPKFLLNLGIHGAAQYVAGIKKAGLVISINTNPECPILEISDYHFTGDALSFVKELNRII